MQVFISVRKQMQNLWGICVDIIVPKQLDKVKQFNNTEEQRFHSSQLSHVIFRLWNTEELEKSPSLMSSVEVFCLNSTVCKKKKDSDLD